MFGRKKATDTAADPHLTFMTEAEAGELRSQVAAEFARQGTQVEVLEDRIVAADGTQYGLWNVAAACHSVGRERRWKGVIAQHVHSVLNPPPNPDEMTNEDLLPLVYSRLYDKSQLEAAGVPLEGAGHDIAEGVIELLAVDFPDTVGNLGAARLAGDGADVLWAAGRARTHALRVGELERLEAAPGVFVTLASSDSYYFASRMADMQGLLADVFGVREYPHGVVVGVPFRHQIVLAPVDTTASLQAIGAAANLTALGYSDAPGAISPLLYWWNGDTFQAITHFAEDGTVGIAADGPFLDAINALTA